MPVDWAKVRSEFPALQNWTFLNTATFGQLPRCGTEAVRRHFEHRDELACSDFLRWFDDMDHIRELAAKLIRCNADDIAFVPNASTALAILINGLTWRTGDRIVALEGEFPNNSYFPAVLGKQGVEFVETSWENFESAVTPATRLVLMSTVNYSTGFRPPVEKIARFLRDRGVVFYLDGTQSVGALAFDTAAVQPDVFAVHAYKWLLSPNGAGFVYVRPELRETLPPNVVGWRSDRGWRSVDQLNHGVPQFSDAAEKYEGGMLSFAPLYAMGAVIEMILELGPAVIERRVMELAALTRTMLKEAGAEILHEDSPIIAARLPGLDASKVARELKERRIQVSAR
ncbi:MAG: aminotransferase class V-fold PLP-dependent enzyme, partial [Bryobacteraceae bacterium]